jgi:tRNA (guanine26-N2/guanine27-N2)-dimethyltransferase
MNEPISYQQIVEGTTSVYVPKQDTKQKGPGKKQGLPFYNPAMELNRDFSIALVQWFIQHSKKKHVSLLDGLASTGIRGIRFIHELCGSFDVIINDWSKEAFTVIQKNVEYTKSNLLRCSNEDLNQLLLKQSFDYIDVDPFGSPVLFIDAAMKSIRHQGILAVSATDTAALCGVYPKVCKRRYAANPYHGSVMHEVGLRILLGFVAREATKHDMGILPILSYKTDHYFRIYLQVLHNVERANKTAQYIQCIPASSLFPFDSLNDYTIGPLWTGHIHSKENLKNIRQIIEKKQFGTKRKMVKLLTIFQEEAEAPMGYFSTDDLGSLLHCSPPKLDQLWMTFRKENIPIFKTQFNPTGFKTPASIQQVKELFLSSRDKNE